MTFYQGTNDRLAVLIPGRMYSSSHPVLYYARSVLLTQGWSVEEVSWKPEDLVSEEAVIKKATVTLDKVANQNPLVVGKSVGSLVLPLAVKHGWPAIWLTPLLHTPELVDALKSVKSSSLLVGGTADDAWDGNVARASGQQVLELPGADHSLEIPGDPLASVGLLEELVATMTLFVKSL